MFIPAVFYLKNNHLRRKYLGLLNNRLIEQGNGQCMNAFKCWRYLLKRLVVKAS